MRLFFSIIGKNLMEIELKSVINLLLVLVFLSVEVHAANQDNNKINDKAVEKPGRLRLRRDPFTPSNLMYEFVGIQANRSGDGYGFIPSSENSGLPRMKLRGLLNNRKGGFIALLEVAGAGTFMVREGDEFNIDPSKPKNAIRVSKITRLSVTIETGRLGVVQVLR